MKRFFAICTVLLLIPFSGIAQEDDDPGVLARFLQDSLSGAGRDVRVTGFRGALSSRATIERMTIADDTGIWLVMEDIALDWNRLRVLRGEIDINELSAGTLQVLRPPVSESEVPSPESSVFSLPELPVSIDIGTVAIGTLELDEPVLGQKLTATVDGTAKLADGAGSTDLSLERTDGKRGIISIDGGYANATQVLKLNLNVIEGADGIIADKLDLPGKPALEFVIAGEDPVSDFTADVKLNTDGMDRFSGTVSVSTPADAEVETTFFKADLGGDISPLFDPEYQAFFGDETTLSVEGSKVASGPMTLKFFDLDTAALDLQGSLTLAADGLPEEFDLTGTVRSGDQIAALLPIPGEQVRLGRADVKAAFQAGESDNWSFTASFDDLEQGDRRIGSGTLEASGQISRKGRSGQDALDVRQVTADIKANLNDFTAQDPAMSRAFGTDIVATTSVSWADGQPFDISAYEIQSEGSRLFGGAQIAGREDNLRITGDMILSAQDIDRYSDLVGQQLGGSADFQLSGWFEPLGRAFDIALTGQTIDLKTGPETVQNLLRGQGELGLAVSRSTDGVDLKVFQISTDALSASASGALKSTNSDLTFDGQLNDIATFATGFSGPLKLKGTAKQTGAPWTVDVAATGPAGSTVNVAGSIATDPTLADLKITGGFPIGLINKFMPNDTLINGNAVLNLGLNGPLDLTSLTGSVSTDDATVSLATANLSLSNVALTANLAGNSVNIASSAAVSRGGTISASGNVGLSAPFNSTLDVALTEVNYTVPPTLSTTLQGRIAVSGPLTQGPTIAGAIQLLETEIRLVSFGSGGAVPDIEHIGAKPRVEQTLTFAGLERNEEQTSQSSNPINLNLTVTAPRRIFIRGSGVEAEMQGELQLTGTSENTIPIGRFNLVRGRLDFLGRRLDLVEGELSMQGSFDPYLRVVAQTQTNRVTVRVTVEGDPNNPEISFLSQPALPEDEIIAELLFGKPISEMTPLEAASLANEVAKLAGSSRGGILDGVREDVGLDTLGVTTSDDGNLALQAGSYLTDNVYTDVVVDAQGKSRIDLNIDVTNNFTLRGSADNQGSTGIGIFFERDY